MDGEVLLSAGKVRVEYGTLVAVRDVSFDLRAGDLLGLIGPNGAGKTTLLRALAGLMAPTAGDVRVMGQDLYADEADLRRHIGFAPDAPPAYEELTVEGFLTFIGQAYGMDWSTTSERIDYWLEQMWLSDRRTEKISKLSRGMKQRVTVARTLMPIPNVVLLDEPSQGLDPAGRIQLREVVASLRDQGKAVVVSSHILADLEEYCTHIAIIERGSIQKLGAVRSLTGRAEGRYRYHLSLANSWPDLESLLSSIDGITDVVAGKAGLTFEYDEDPAKAANLLRDLVERGLPVAEFGLMPETLEETYLKAGVRQVD